MRHINEKQLWDLTVDMKSKKVPIREFNHFKDQVVWGEEYFSFGNFLPHALRVIAANLCFPIIVIKNNDDKWSVLDGMHRLAKAYAYGHTEVSVIELPEEYSDVVVVGDYYE